MNLVIEYKIPYTFKCKYEKTCQGITPYYCYNIDNDNTFIPLDFIKDYINRKYKLECNIYDDKGDRIFDFQKEMNYMNADTLIIYGSRFSYILLKVDKEHGIYPYYFEYEQTSHN